MGQIHALVLGITGAQRPERMEKVRKGSRGSASHKAHTVKVHTNPCAQIRTYIFPKEHIITRTKIYIHFYTYVHTHLLTPSQQNTHAHQHTHAHIHGHACVDTLKHVQKHRNTKHTKMHTQGIKTITEAPRGIKQHMLAQAGTTTIQPASNVCHSSWHEWKTG